MQFDWFGSILVFAFAKAMAGKVYWLNAEQALMTQHKLRNAGLASPKLIAKASHEELIGIVNDLREKLKKKNHDLTRTRERLSKARSRIQKLKGIVSYQRARIIELHT